MLHRTQNQANSLKNNTVIFSIEFRGYVLKLVFLFSSCFRPLAKPFFKNYLFLDQRGGFLLLSTKFSQNSTQNQEDSPNQTNIFTISIGCDLKLTLGNQKRQKCNYNHLKDMFPVLIKQLLKIDSWLQGKSCSEHVVCDKRSQYIAVLQLPFVLIDKNYFFKKIFVFSSYLFFLTKSNLAIMLSFGFNACFLILFNLIVLIVMSWNQLF